MSLQRKMERKRERDSSHNCSLHTKSETERSNLKQAFNLKQKYYQEQTFKQCE